MYYIYIIYSEGSNKFYVGHTDNLKRRIEEHNSDKKNSYTKKHRPWKLATSFPVGNSRGEALKIERYIKKQKSRKFILELIENKDNLEKIAQMVRVPMHQRFFNGRKYYIFSFKPKI